MTGGNVTVTATPIAAAEGSPDSLDARARNVATDPVPRFAPQRPVRLSA